MKARVSSLKAFDLILIALVLAVALLSGFAIYGNRTGRVRLVIEAPSGSWIYSLDTERTVEIPGPLGNTTIRIENGEASITASPCPNQTCIAAHPLHSKGEWNACLPNHVLLRIEGDAQEGEVDAVAQ